MLAIQVGLIDQGLDEDGYGVWREGANDGMVFALAFAIWHAERALRRELNRPRIQGTTVTSCFR